MSVLIMVQNGGRIKGEGASGEEVERETEGAGGRWKKQTGDESWCEGGGERRREGDRGRETDRDERGRLREQGEIDGVG